MAALSSTEAAPPFPPRRRLRSPVTPQFSEATATKRWAWANACLVSRDAATNRPVIDDCQGQRRIESPRQLADYLLRNRLSVTASTDGQLAVLWRVFPAGFCAALAKAQPGTPIMFEGDLWRTAGEDGLSVQRGLEFGRLANLSRMLPEGMGETPQGISQWAKGFFNALDGAGFPDAGATLSPGALGERFLLSYAALPDLRRPDLATAHLRRACAADKGGRMEAVKLGTFDKVWCYDFVSAYAACLESLPACDPRDCRWFESRDYQPSAYYGFIRAAVKVPSMPLSPMAFHLPNAAIHELVDGLRFPYGEATVWLTKPEHDLLRDLGCSLTIQEASWGIVENEYLPFANLVERIFDLRKSSPEWSGAMKLILVAMIGKMGSVHYAENYRTLRQVAAPAASFNPIYSAYVRALQRVKLVKAATTLFAPEHIVGLTIDGILSSAPASQEVSGKRGELRLEGVGPATILTDYIKDRPGKTPVWREAAELTGQGKEFKREFTFHGRLGLFRQLRSETEAHDRLGMPITMTPTFPIGSVIRQTPATPDIRDYLRGVIPTSPQRIDQMREASNPNLDLVWGRQMNFADLMELWR